MGRKRQVSALALMVLALTAGTASAALFKSGGENAAGPGIELVNNDTSTAGRLARILDEATQPGMTESILRRHTRSTTKVGAPMGGHYAREGSEAPLLMEERGARSFTGQVSGYVGNDTIPTSLALAAVTHVVDSGAHVSAPVVATSSGSTIAVSGSALATNGNNNGQPITPVNGNNQTSIPLPPAALLLASGLIGLPVVKRSQRTND